MMRFLIALTNIHLLANRSVSHWRQISPYLYLLLFIEYFMLEKHRLTYLDALGIENYMPRYQLNNALPSQLLSDDVLRESTAFSTADVPTVELDVELTSNGELTDSSEPECREKNAPNTMPDVAADVMNALGIAPNVSNNSTPPAPNKISHPSPVKVSEDGDKKEAAIRFSLNIWRIQNELLVIDSREPATALPTEKLLQNILRSIGYPLAQLPPSDLVRWPLFTNNKFTNNKFTNKKLAQASINQSSEEDEARAMVQAYLSAQCNRAPVKALLLLGKNAASFALTPNGDIDAFYDQHKGTVVDTPLWESKVLVLPSLVDMLHEPMQKRLTWQALQTLATE
jgi:hypothetical protein